MEVAFPQCRGSRVCRALCPNSSSPHGLLGIGAKFPFFFLQKPAAEAACKPAGPEAPCRGCVHHPASGLGWAAGPAPAPAGGLVQALASLSLCRGVLGAAVEGFEAQRGVSVGGNELGGTARPGKHLLAAPAAPAAPPHHRLLGAGTCRCLAVPRAGAGSGFSTLGLHVRRHAGEWLAW